MLIITNEVFMRFLTQIKAKVECPVCDSANWNLSATYKMATLANSDDLVVSHFPFAQLDEETGRTTTFVGGTPVVYACCNVCGYIRFHSHSVIHLQMAQWGLDDAATEGNNHG